MIVFFRSRTFYLVLRALVGERLPTMALPVMELWSLLKSRVNEICVKRIRVNQGVGVLLLLLSRAKNLIWP